MSKKQDLNYLTKKFLYKYILKKDIMELKVQYYRNNGVQIGTNMRTFSNLMSSEPYLLEFGDDITVSSGVRFITHDNSCGKIIENSSDLMGKIKIGNNCFIGQNSIILPGVEIGNNIVVGAGSVVTRSFLEDGVIIAGNPAKVVSTIEKYKEKYIPYAFDTKYINFDEKKKLILSNEDKLLKK